MTTPAPTRRSIHWLDVTAVLGIATALGFALLTPAERTQGTPARMLYLHVPTIWLAYVAFVVTLIGSVAYLITRRMRWDHVAEASAEIGVLFTGLAVIDGMIWAKPIWGVYWTWDARLTLTAIMFFVYVGYLALRRTIGDPETRARRAAILGVVGVLQIPIVHFSVIWWRTLHQPPTLLRPDEMQIDPPLLAALWIGVAAFTLLYAALMRHRIELARLELALHEDATAPAGPVAGDAVSAPEVTAGRNRS
jgi:heme exporter protein C